MNSALRSFGKAAVLCAVFLAALSIFSCGGGGGGSSSGGAVGTTGDGGSDAQVPGSIWGGGSPADAGVSDLPENSLIQLLPAVPVSSVDLHLSLNGTAQPVMTGVTLSSTLGEFLKSVPCAYNDVLSGYADVHLADGSTRKAYLHPTRIGSDADSTTLAFYTEYAYRIVTGSGAVVQSGLFTTDGPLDVSSSLSGTLYGYPSDLTVTAFSDGTDTYPVSGGSISPARGDKVLTPIFVWEPSVVCSGTGVTPYGGADSYVYDYAQNTSGVTLTVAAPALPGVTLSGTVDGNAVTLSCGASDYSTALLPGQHEVSLTMNGGSDFAGSGQTISKTISVYVKPDVKIKESSKIKYFAADDVYKYSYLTYSDNMPVEVVSDAATDLASYITMTNTYLDGSTVTATTTTTVGTHTISADFTGGYCVNPGIKNVSVKIKPVKVQLSGQFRTWNRLYEEEKPCPRHNIYLQAGNPDNEYPEERTFQLNFGDATGSDDGDHARNYYWGSTPSDKNYVWLSAKTSTFYMWTDQAYDYYTGHYMGKINKDDPYTTRTLEDLISNRSFDSEDHNGNGDHDWGAGYRTRMWFGVSLNDDVEP